MLFAKKKQNKTKEMKRNDGVQGGEKASWPFFIRPQKLHINDCEAALNDGEMHVPAVGKPRAHALYRPWVMRTAGREIS